MVVNKTFLGAPIRIKVVYAIGCTLEVFMYVMILGVKFFEGMHIQCVISG